MKIVPHGNLKNISKAHENKHKLKHSRRMSSRIYWMARMIAWPRPIVDNKSSQHFFLLASRVVVSTIEIASFLGK